MSSFHGNVHYIHADNDQPSGRKRGREEDEQSDDTEGKDQNKAYKKDSRVRKRRKRTGPEPGQAAPAEAAPQPVNDISINAGTDQGDREEPTITTAIADVREVAIDDIDNSRSSDPSGDGEDGVRGDSSDAEADDGDGNGAEGEFVGVNVSCTICSLYHTLN